MSETIEVRDASERSRFELHVDGGLVSLVDYSDAGDVRTFPHTETLPGFGGNGYGTRVVRAALDEAVASGRTVVPACPFVAAIVRQHPDEYGDLVA